MEKDNVQVSIIIPVYNACKTIDRCLNSVIKQTYKNIEAIVVDDGSTDKSQQLIDQFAKRDKQIIKIAQKNSGVSSARNVGILHAKGKYITFLDSDDYLEPDCIETMIQGIGSSDLLIGRYKLKKSGQESSFNLNAKIHYKKSMQLENILILNQQATKYCLMQPWGKLFKKSIICKHKIKFDKSISLGEDTLFVLDYLQNINDAILINNQVYIYDTSNEHSLSATGKNAADTLTARVKIIHKRMEIAKHWGEYNRKIDDMTLSDIAIILKEFAADKKLNNSRIIDLIKKVKNDKALMNSVISANPSKISHAIIAKVFILSNWIGPLLLIKVIRIVQKISPKLQD